MLFRDLWNYLHTVHEVVNTGDLKAQDKAINALFRFLHRRKDQRFPTLLYGQAIRMLRRYPEHVLPALSYYTAEDRQTIAENYRILEEQLQEATTISQQVERAFEQLLECIRKGIFSHTQEAAEASLKIARFFFDPQDLKGFQKPFRSGHPFQELLTVLQENFRYAQAAKFFQGFLAAFLEEPIASATSQSSLPMYNFKTLFEYVLESYFQGKAVMVDSFRHGHIMSLWISMECDKTSEGVEFLNQNIDDSMQASAETARCIAREYLLDEYGKHVPENLVVQCCFPKHDVSFKDTSASLLIGIRIVGEVLGVKSRPATVVTGEVGESGEILKVGFINEKIEAASKREEIEWMIIPEANVPEISPPPLVGGVRGRGSESSVSFSPPPNLPHQGGGMTIIPVRTFDEAVQHVLDLHWEDWGEAPGLDVFYGRQEELDEIQHWVFDEHCHLVAILGMGGIGKTTLTRKLTKQIKKHFQYLFWRDLRNAPPVENILDDCIKFLSHQQQISLPEEVDSKVSLLISYLKKHRCLLVLDNMETLLQGGEGRHMGVFREGYAGYSTLLQRIGGIEHQSCLILTSREKPREIEQLEGKMVRALFLHGLKQIEAGNFLRDLFGTEQDRNVLVDRYGGHPLALKLTAATVQDVFHDDIAAFLREETSFIGSIETLLEQHHNRLSRGEQEIIYWLAIAREAMSFSGLRNDIVNPVLRRKLPEVIKALQRKSLIEISDAGFTLQPVVMEYMTEQVIEQVCEELSTGTISLLNSHALMKAQAKEYIRESQKRLILRPIVENLEYEYELDRQEIESKLKDILVALREKHSLKPGYAAGNILNALLYLNRDLRGYDFSHLPVWQAYLQGAELHEVNFTNADLRGSVFTDTFGNILSVTCSRDGKYLAAGTLSREIRIWDASDYQQFHTCTGHTGWVWSVAFSPDGKLLASGSQDCTVKLWEVAIGKCVMTLEGHTTWVVSVSFSPDGHLLASGGADGMKIWDVQTGRTLLTLQDHTQGVYAITFRPDGKVLASGRADHTIQLWNVPADEPLCVENISFLRLHKTLHGHTDRVRSIAFNLAGDLLASGSDDQTLRIWDTRSEQCLNTLYGHTDLVKSVAFSSDGDRLASSSNDGTIRIWDVRTWQCLKTLQGHENWVWSVTFKPNECVLVSGASDQSVRVWDTVNGQCIKTIEGYTNRTLSLAFRPDGTQFVTSHSDKDIRLWKWKDKQWQCCRTFQGHRNWVMSVAFSPDGKTFASGSSDESVRIWDVITGDCLKIFQKPEGHSGMVRSVAFSPDGNTLLSCSDDNTIRIWELQREHCSHILFESERILSVAFRPDGKLLASGSQDHGIRMWNIEAEKCLDTFQGHGGPVRSVAFSPDGKILASGSEDRSVRLWHIATGECAEILHEHTKPVRAVAFSPNGNFLASGSEDQTVRLWDMNTWKCLTILNCFGKQDEESNWVWSVAFSPDGQILASAGEDGTIRLWDIQTGEYLDTLQPDRPYEQMNITGVTGVSEAQKVTLRVLGAIDEPVGSKQ
jgi:WD40 repeat protein